MKQLTLNQTWTLCLRMWRWIAKEWRIGGKKSSILKKRWLRGNGFKVSQSESGNCFFCVYVREHGDNGECLCCPGALVESDFECGDAGWSSDPPAFYKELLRLNKIRKGKK